MKTDFLKELGLEKDVIDKIMAENGKDIEGYKAQVSQLETEKANLTQQLGDANTQIEGFRSLDVEGIKAAADEYKAKFEASEKKAKAENGTIIGLEEQIKQLKADNDYLFESDAPAPKIISPTGSSMPPAGDDAAIRAIMGLGAKE